MLTPLNLGQLNIVRIKIIQKRTYLLNFNAFLWQSILHVCVCVCVCVSARARGEIVCDRACEKDRDYARVRDCVCVERLCMCVERLCVTARVKKIVTTRV